MSCCNDKTIYECDQHGDVTTKFVIIRGKCYCEECVIGVLKEQDIEPVHKLIQVCGKHES